MATSQITLLEVDFDAEFKGLTEIEIEFKKNVERLNLAFTTFLSRKQKLIAALGTSYRLIRTETKVILEINVPGSREMPETTHLSFVRGFFEGYLEGFEYAE